MLRSPRALPATGKSDSCVAGLSHRFRLEIHGDRSQLLRHVAEVHGISRLVSAWKRMGNCLVRSRLADRQFSSIPRRPRSRTWTVSGKSFSDRNPPRPPLPAGWDAAGRVSFHRLTPIASTMSGVSTTTLRNGSVGFHPCGLRTHPGIKQEAAQDYFSNRSISRRTSSILTSWSGCFQRTFPSEDRMTMPWDSNPSSLTVFVFSSVVASRFRPCTFPPYSCSNPLTAGFTFAQIGQPGM